MEKKKKFRTRSTVEGSVLSVYGEEVEREQLDRVTGLLPAGRGQNLAWNVLSYICQLCAFGSTAAPPPRRDVSRACLFSRAIHQKILFAERKKTPNRTISQNKLIQAPRLVSAAVNRCDLVCITEWRAAKRRVAPSNVYSSKFFDSIAFPRIFTHTQRTVSQNQHTKSRISRQQHTQQHFFVGSRTEQRDLVCRAPNSGVPGRGSRDLPRSRAGASSALPLLRVGTIQPKSPKKAKKTRTVSNKYQHPIETFCGHDRTRARFGVLRTEWRTSRKSVAPSPASSSKCFESIALPPRVSHSDTPRLSGIHGSCGSEAARM